MSVYLSTDEYLARFGPQETARLTHEDPASAPAVDAGKLQEAIDGTESLVDGYLRQRYQLPLAAAPSEIKEIVADLARERLHKTRPLQAVTEAADRARSTLRDLSAGRMTLLVAGGEPERTDASFAAWGHSGPALVFNPEKLEGFGGCL